MWDNGSNKKKRRLKSKDIRLGKTLALLTELGFYDKAISSTTKVKPEIREREIGDDRIVSVTGAVYSTERSILKDVLSRLYGQRKEYKKESFRLQQKAYDLEQVLKKDDN